MRALYLLHFVLMTAVMSTTWLSMYVPSLEAQYAQTVSTAVFLCYLILSIFFYRTYNAYKIGMYRAGETFYSQTLANLFSNVLTYIFACLIRQRLLTCLPALAALAVQTTISGIWCLAANKLYFSTHKPLRTLVIYKEDEDLDKLNEIVFFENRFDVIERIQSPEDVFELLPRLNGYRAVIVSGVEATLRNGIVKYSAHRTEASELMHKKYSRQKIALAFEKQLHELTK